MSGAKVTTRRQNYSDYKCWVTTNHFESGGRHYNTLYLHFCKDDFALDYPKIVPCDWGWGRRFDYVGYLSDLDWHCGVSFYEEMTHGESGKTYVKVGCDYSHLWDDAYMSGDYGESILETDGKRIAEQFHAYVNKEVKA